jgi:hypothetical protein
VAGPVGGHPARSTTPDRKINALPRAPSGHINFTMDLEAAGRFPRDVFRLLRLAAIRNQT